MAQICGKDNILNNIAPHWHNVKKMDTPIYKI